MNFRQALALHLSTDLHSVARRLRDVDLTLDQAAHNLRSLVVLAPEDLKGSGIYEVVEATLADVVEAQALAIELRADLTGRRPEAFLKGRKP